MAEIHNQRDGIDPLLEANFNLEIEGIPSIGVKSFSEPKKSFATSKYREGNQQPWHRKQRGLASYEPITIERGIIKGDTRELEQWFELGDRRTVDVVRLDHLAQPSGIVYRLYEVFPSELNLGKGDAGSEDGPAILSMTIEIEDFDNMAS